MEVLVFLVPLALTLGAIGLMGFLWSLKNGQYDDLEGAGWRAIADDEAASEETVPSAGKPQGCFSPKITRESTCWPTDCGSSRAWAICPSRSTRMRSTSALRNAGWSATSAKISTVASSVSESAVTERRDESASLEVA